jgi:ribosomal protein L16 Arg81 hydroxylase
MNLSLGKTLLAVALFTVTAAHAQQNIYSCKDATGRTITSDLPIPECAMREQRILNRDGSTRQVIAAPLTPEQKRAKQAEEARLKAEEEARADGLRRDKALLSAYRTEADLSEAFVRLIDVPTQALRASPARMKPYYDEIKKIREEGEFFVGKTWPISLRRRIDNVLSAIAQEQRAIAEKEGEIQRISARYAEDLRRYRALVEAAKTAPKQ